jgi:hypothetical protein
MMMIRLKQLLREMTDSDLKRTLEKIRNKQFKLFGQGDNGRVYEIEGEDKLFKITTEQEEYQVAEVIINRYSEFTTFIPVYYVDGNNMYVMAKASELSGNQRADIDQFIENYKNYARSEGGEVSIFDYLDADGARDTDVRFVNFLRALQRDVQKTGISDLDLDLDFKTDNIMVWNNKLVMIDW